MPQPPRNPGLNVSRLHRLSRERGLRWELTVKKRFDREGFYVERTDEIDGFTRGVDLRLRHTQGPNGGPGDYYPVGIQCKRTAHVRDVLVGLREAQKGMPNAKIWICCHREHLRSGVRGRDTYAVSLVAHPDSIYTDLTFSGMILLLRKTLSGLDPLH